MAEKRTLTENREQVGFHEWSPVNENGKPKSSGEIEMDIEQTREEMNQLLDTLAYRMSPGRVVSKVRQKSVKAVKSNKLPLLLMASGAAWMLWEIGHQDGKRNEKFYQREPEEEHSRYIRGRDEHIIEPGKEYRTGFNESSSETPGMKEKFQGGIESARNKKEEIQSGFQEKRDQIQSNVQQKGQELKEKAQSGYESARQRASYYSGEVRGRSREMLDRTDKTMRENPMMAGLAAALAGIFVGLLLPVSQTEKRSIGRNVREVFKQAKEKGKEALETGKEIAGSVAQTAKEESQKQGLQEKASESLKGGDSSGLASSISETTRAAAEKAEEKINEKQQRRKAA